MREEINSLYLELMHYTLLVAREASRAQDSVWCEHEIELIHNLPFAIREDQDAEKLYFYNVTLILFMNWLHESNHDEANKYFRLTQREIVDRIKHSMMAAGLISSS